MKSVIFLSVIKYLKRNRSKARNTVICLSIILFFILCVFELSNGIASYLLSKYAPLGENFVLINADTFSNELLSDLSEISVKTPLVEFDYQAIDWSINEYFEIIATNDEKIRMKSGNFYECTLLKGRLFNQYEKNRSDNNVILFQNDTVDSGYEIGQTIHIDGRSFEIVGIVSASNDNRINEPFVESDTNMKKISIFMPIVNEFVSDNYAISGYYCVYIDNNMFDSAVRKIDSVFLSFSDINYSITTSNDIIEEIVKLKSVINAIMIGLSLFSIIVGVLVLSNTLNLILSDLTETFVFFRIQSVDEKILKIWLILISAVIVSVALIISTGISSVLAILIYTIWGINCSYSFFEWGILTVVCIAVSILAASYSNVKIKKIDIMSIFRG